MNFSKKNPGSLSLAGPEILAFVSQCSANFQQILDCFIPNFNLKYLDSENIKAGRLYTVVFNVHQIKRWAFFLGHLVGEQYCGNNKKRSHTQLDSRKQVIAFQDRVITINIKEAQHPLK